MPQPVQRRVIGALLPLAASSLLSMLLLSEHLSSIHYSRQDGNRELELLSSAPTSGQTNKHSIHLSSKAAVSSGNEGPGKMQPTSSRTLGSKNGVPGRRSWLSREEAQAQALSGQLGKRISHFVTTAWSSATNNEEATELRHAFSKLSQSLKGENGDADEEGANQTLGAAFEWHEGEAVGERKDTGIEGLDEMIDGEEEVDKKVRKWVDTWRPEWIAARYMYLVLATLVAVAFIVAFLGLRKMERIRHDFAAWTQVSQHMHVYRVFLWPDFFKNIVDALFMVARPLIVLRHFHLGVAHLGILTVVQPLMALFFTHWAHLRLAKVGNKEVEIEGIWGAIIGGVLMLGMLLPVTGDWAWLSGGPLGSFCLLVLAEAFVGAGLTLYGVSLNNAMANPGVMPTSWAERTTQVLFAVSMLAKFFGAVIAGEMTEYVGVQLVYTLPLLLFVVMLSLVWSCPKEWFPEDPDKKLMPLPLPPLPWESSIWMDSEARWLMITYTSYAVLYASISTSFSFALPLIALEEGFTDEEVGFLIAMPSFIGFSLFWTGGASGVRLSLRGAIVSLVIGAAHLLLAGMHSFGMVALATCIYAIAVANAGGLVNAIRICYARLMACRGMKAHFASISGSLGQADNLLNIPIITTIISFSSIALSLVVYAVVSIVTAFWYSIVMRDRLDQVQRLFVNDTLPDKVNEAMAMFKEVQKEQDEAAGAEEKEDKGEGAKEGAGEEEEPTVSIIQIMAYLEKNKLQREGMLTMLEMVDEKLDGRITEEQFVNCMRASHELESDSVHGSGSSFAHAASLRKTGSERSSAPRSPLSSRRSPAAPSTP